MLQFLIVCPLVFLAGFVDAVAGGGGLISLPAYMLSGVPVHNAIATNKLSSSMGTTLATIRYGKKGYIPWKLAIFAVISAYTGSTLGARLALIVTDYYFKIIMLVILPLVAAYVMFGKGLKEEKEPYSFGKTAVLASVFAFFIGGYDGFYGPGTGTFLILALTSLANMSLEKANGVTKAINLTTNIASLVVYLINGKVLLLLGLAAGCFNVAGSFLGTKFFMKGGSKAVKPIMIVVLVIFMAKLIMEFFELKF